MDSPPVKRLPASPNLMMVCVALRLRSVLDTQRPFASIRRESVCVSGLGGGRVVHR